jgi:excisionase family DNA binding protein
MGEKFELEARVAYRVKRACEQLDISPSTFWKFVRLGKIRVVRVGGRVLVPHEELLRIASEGVSSEGEAA